VVFVFVVVVEDTVVVVVVVVAVVDVMVVVLVTQYFALLNSITSQRLVGQHAISICSKQPVSSV